MLGIFLLLGTKLGFKHGFKYDCMKVHLSRIHSLPAVCQASIVSCGALPFSSLPLPQPALCFSAHHSHLLCTTQCSLHELLLLYTAELRTMLCLPLLSVTSLTIITVSKAGILWPCLAQTFAHICLLPSFSPTGAEVKQLMVGAMRCSVWCI